MTWWKKLLNLPDVESSRSSTRGTANWADATSASARSSNSTTAWHVERETRIMRGWVWFLRGTIIITLLILAWLGVVHIIRGDPPRNETSQPIFGGVDTHAAADMAKRFALAYLSWDEDDPEAHAVAIARDWADAQNGGWNKKGKQTADSASVLAVDVIDNTHVDVTVLVRIVAHATDGNEVPTWIALKVPTRITDGRAAVANSPAIVGIPAPAKPDFDNTSLHDPELSEQTREMATKFFAAYAAGDVSAVTAPGSTIQAPTMSGQATLTSWTVYSRAGETQSSVEPHPDTERHATAIVSWTNNNVILTQTYQVTISLVSGQSQSRWQISAIN